MGKTPEVDAPHSVRTPKAGTTFLQQGGASLSGNTGAGRSDGRGEADGSADRVSAEAELRDDGLRRENHNVVLGGNCNNNGSLVAVALAGEGEASTLMVVRRATATEGDVGRTVSDGRERVENGDVVPVIGTSRIDRLSATSLGQHSRAIADNGTDEAGNVVTEITTCTTIIEKETVTTEIRDGPGSTVNPQGLPSQNKRILPAPTDPFRSTTDTSPIAIFPHHESRVKPQNRLEQTGKEAGSPIIPSVVAKEEPNEQSPRNFSANDRGNDELISLANDSGNGAGNDAVLLHRESDSRNDSGNTAAAEAPRGEGTSEVKIRPTVSAHMGGHLPNKHCVGDTGIDNNRAISNHHNTVVGKELLGHATECVDDDSDLYATDTFENGSSEARYETTAFTTNNVLSGKEEGGDLRGDAPSPHMKANNARRKKCDDASGIDGDTLAQRNKTSPRNAAGENGGASPEKLGSSGSTNIPILVPENPPNTRNLANQGETVGFTGNGKCETVGGGRSQGGTAPQTQLTIARDSLMRDRARLLERASGVRAYHGSSNSSSSTEKSCLSEDFVRGVLEEGATLVTAAAAATATGVAIDSAAKEPKDLSASPEAVPPERNERVYPWQSHLRGGQYLGTKRLSESDHIGFPEQESYTHKGAPPAMRADLKGNGKCETAGGGRSQGGAAPRTIENTSSIRDKVRLLERAFGVRLHRGDSSTEKSCLSRDFVCGVLEEGETLAAAAATVATRAAMDSAGSEKPNGDRASPEPPKRNIDVCPQRKHLRDGPYAGRKCLFESNHTGSPGEGTHIQNETSPATHAYRNNSRSGGDDDDDDRSAEPLDQKHHLPGKGYGQPADNDNSSCEWMMQSVIGGCEDATAAAAAAVVSESGRAGGTVGGGVGSREVWGCGLEHPARAFRLLWRRNR